MNTKGLSTSVALLLGVLATTAAFSAPPSGSTGECKDGTYTSAQSKRGACAGHGGVKTWFEQKKAAKESSKSAAKKESSKSASKTESSKAAAKTESKATAKSESSKATAKTKSSKAQATAATEAPARAAPSTGASAPASKKTATANETANAPAAHGGPGMVWVNTPTKVYHCSGDRWYGKTEHGEYMSEAEAKAKGYRPSYNKPCS